MRVHRVLSNSSLAGPQVLLVVHVVVVKDIATKGHGDQVDVRAVSVVGVVLRMGTVFFVALET